MSSKSVSNPTPQKPLSQADRWPITRVLGLYYTLSAFSILLLATTFLYWVMQRSLEQQNFHVLVDQIEILRSILKEKPHDLEALTEEIQFEGAARTFAKFHARVLDDHGHVLVQTDDMEWLLPTNVFPSAMPVPAQLKTVAQQRYGGEKWLLMAAWAEKGSEKDPHLLQLALNVTQNELVLVQYRRMLGLVLLAGIFCSAAAGAFIARRGMRPLAEITEAARRIGAKQLDERITPAKWPRELTALATAFDEMLARLEASFGRLSQFSADLAHEFRTPVTNLRVEAEVALTRSRTTEEYRRVLESSLEEYERLSRMIDSLLFLARAENAETILQRSRLNLAREVEAVVAYYEAAAAEKNITVTAEGDGQLEADSVLFRRAVSNVLANAIRYTPQGGKVTVSIPPVSNGCLEILVRDSGGGIAREHLPRVFDRFYRVDPSRSHQGTGLGLAIVKSIVELHGGQVGIESEAGNGTVVILRFPLTQFLQPT